MPTTSRDLADTVEILAGLGRGIYDWGRGLSAGWVADVRYRVGRRGKQPARVGVQTRQWSRVKMMTKKPRGGDCFEVGVILQAEPG